MTVFLGHVGVVFVTSELARDAKVILLRKQ